MTVASRAGITGAVILLAFAQLVIGPGKVSSSEKPVAAIDKERVRDADIQGLSGAVAHFLMASFYDNFGEIDAATLEYEEALRLQPDEAEIYLKIGADFVIQGNMEKAKEYLVKAKELEPGNVRPYLLLAVIHTAKGEFPEAEALYEEALKHEPGNLKALTFLSDLFVIQQELDKAAEVYEKILRVKKDDAFIFFNLGIIYSKLDKLDKAEENLNKAIELDEGYIEAQMVLGYVYEIEGKYQEAIKQYNKVLAIDTLNKDAHLRLGQLYYHAGQADKAIEENRVLIRLDMDSPEAYLRIFSIHMAERKYGEAEAILLEAIRNGVSSGVIYVSLGYLAGVTGENRKAMDYYGVAADKEPDNPMYKFYLGAAMDRSGKRDEAIKVLESIVAADPQGIPEAFNYLGYIYVEKNENLDRAIELIRKALEEDPENGAYMDSLAWAYFKKGMIKEALAEIEKALETMPDDPTIREHSGDIKFALGDTAGAQAEWARSLVIDPGNAAVKLKLEKLRSTANEKK